MFWETKIKRLTSWLTRLLKEQLEPLRKTMKFSAFPSRDSWRKEERIMEKGMIISGENCDQNIPIRKRTTPNPKEDMISDALIHYLQDSEYKIHSNYKKLHHTKVKVHMHPDSLSRVDICLFMISYRKTMGLKMVSEWSLAATIQALQWAPIGPTLSILA